MAETTASISAEPRSPLEAVVATGRRGRRGGAAGVTVSELRGFGIAAVTARRGAGSMAVARVQEVLGLALPKEPRWIEADSLAAVWAGPERWLVLRPRTAPMVLEHELGPALAGVATVVDLSHASVLLRVGGPRVREALAKGVTIDLHPRAFSAGMAAMTVVAHMPVQLWQVSQTPTYELLAPRSYARDLWHWLEAAAAEHGLDVVAPGVSLHGS